MKKRTLNFAVRTANVKFSDGSELTCIILHFDGKKVKLSFCSEAGLPIGRTRTFDIINSNNLSSVVGDEIDTDSIKVVSIDNFSPEYVKKKGNTSSKSVFSTLGLIEDIFSEQPFSEDESVKSPSSSEIDDIIGELF